MTDVEYLQGADLPDLAITWLNSAGNLVDFTTGYSFELKVGRPGSVALFTKSTGFSASLTDPNLTVAWANTGELNTIAAGQYRCQIRATRISDNKQRAMDFWLTVLPSIL